MTRRLAATLLTLLFVALQTASAQTTFKGVVVGDELDWDSNSLALTLEVSESTAVTLDIYSPGFDPNDYRAALEGRSELGDERYDRGTGEISATYSLSRDEQVFASDSYGVEPHRTVDLVAGVLEPGIYTLRADLAGFAKNAFIYTIAADNPEAVKLFIEPDTLLVDPGTGDADGSSVNYTIPRGNFITPFSVNIPDGGEPLTVGIYDGDGPGELMFRLLSPDGNEQELPVSGDLQWRDYTLGAAGTYDFSFRMPDAAYQYSNTIGVRADKRLRIDGDTLVVVRPASYALSKTVDKTVAAPGDTLLYSIDVQNVGDAYGSVTLTDALPTGLSGEGLNESFDLPAGAARNFTLSATVNPDASGDLINEAELTGEGITVSAQASTRIEALPEPTPEPEADPARFTLTKTAQTDTVAVGDSLTFDITVTNVGGSVGEATLRDPQSSGYDGEALSTSFTLEPSASRSFSVTGRVLEDAGERVVNVATLSSSVGSLTATAAVNVTRPEPEVVPEPELEPETQPEPEPQDFALSRFSQIDLHYRAGELASCELGTLEPGQSRDIIVNLTASPDAVLSDSRFDTVTDEGVTARKSDLMREGDSLSYTVTLTNTSNTRQSAQFTDPLPTGASLVQTRECVPTSLNAQQTLLTHVPPAGASYDAGSSRLNGTAIDDPLTDEEGRLYWLIPYSAEGTLSYTAAHEGALEPVQDPTLTVKTASRELQLVGDISLAAHEAAEARFMLADLSTAEAAFIQLRPLDIVADNRNPIRLELRLVDADGNPVASDVFTVEANADFATPDADPNRSGYQVMAEDARAIITLDPQPSPRTLTIRAASSDLLLDTDVALSGAEQGLYQYQLSVIASFGGGVNVTGLARGYAELQLGGGSLQAAVDVGADLENGINTDLGLSDVNEPSERFPLTGAGDEPQGALRSDDGVAVRYDTDAFSAGYYRDELSVPGVSSVGRGTALRAETNGDIQAEGFVALLPSDTVTLTITPDGTRAYFLNAAVQRGSERVTVVTDEGDELLVRDVDYSINYATGAIFLARPLWNTDTDFADIALQITYAPEDAPRDALSYGAGVRYSAGNLSFAAGAAQLGDFRAGASAEYASDTFGVKLGFERNFGDFDTGDDDTSQLTFSARGRLNRLSAQAALSYTEARLSGMGELEYALFERGAIFLRHVGANDANRTSAGYRQSFGNFRASLGLGYAWESSALLAVGGVGYGAEKLDLSLNHSQPLASDVAAQTTFNAKYQLDDNLSADAGLSYLWGQDLSGVLGLSQRLGNANLRLDYQLPTASGEGNRARGGIEVPFALSHRVSLTLNAGATYDLTDSSSELAFGVGARYRGDALSASLGLDVALPETGATKVVVRSQASGQLGKDQTLAFDANYQVSPELTGDLGVSYALKLSRLNLLTYHRLSTVTGNNSLLGEVAPTYVFNPSFQLRPSFAYRFDFNDSDANTFQGSLGALYYLEPNFGSFSPTIGVGGYAHYVTQPGTSSSQFGVTLEGSVQVIEELWLRAGYTFPNDLGGLTPISQGGLYIGLDLLGGGAY